MTDQPTSSRLLARADLLLLIRDLVAGPIHNPDASAFSIEFPQEFG